MSKPSDKQTELSTLVNEVVHARTMTTDCDLNARIMWLLAHTTGDAKLLQCLEDYERATGALAHRGGLAG